MQIAKLRVSSQLRSRFLLGLCLTAALANSGFGQNNSKENYFDRVARALRDKESDRGNRVEFATELAEDSDAIRLVPSLARAIREDSESGVRAAAIKCLALIEKNRKSPCPLVIVDSLLDADEEVRDAASMASMIFDRFTEDSIDSLAKCAQSKDSELRSDGITYLARTGSKEPRVLDIIKRGTQDKNSFVAHNSQVALFAATDDMPTFLLYLIPLRNSAIRSESASVKIATGQEAATRSLHELGAKMLTDRWLTERPKQLADSVYDLLKDDSAEIRLGASLMIEAYAGKSSESSDPLSEWSEFAKSGVKGNARSDTAVEFVKTLVGHKTATRLKSLVDSDSNEAVRDAAKSALNNLVKAEENSVLAAPKE